MDVVDSTNTYAKARYGVDLDGCASALRAASLAACAGGMEVSGGAGERRSCRLPLDAMVANEQTAGRGRLGRTWLSQRGQTLVVTYVAYLPERILRDLGGGWLTNACGLACLEALRDLAGDLVAGAADSATDADATGAPGPEDLRLKWPNDLYCGGRKLGGILCELVGGLPAGCQATGGLDAGGLAGQPVGGRTADSQAEDLVGVAFGIGANLLTPADQLPLATATSLVAWMGEGATRGASGQGPCHGIGLPPFEDLRARLVGQVADRLGAYLGDLATCGREAAERLLPRLREASYTLGRQVEVSRVDGSRIRGRALDILADTALLVEAEDGRRVKVTSGDVGVL